MEDTCDEETSEECAADKLRNGKPADEILQYNGYSQQPNGITNRKEHKRRSHHIKNGNHKQLKEKSEKPSVETIPVPKKKGTFERIKVSDVVFLLLL